MRLRILVLLLEYGRPRNERWIRPDFHPMDRPIDSSYHSE